MNIQQQLEQLKQQYQVLDVVDLDTWTDDYESSTNWLTRRLQAAHQLEYTPEQRLAFLHSRDYYIDGNSMGLILRNLQIALNEVDISNFFVTLISTNPNIEKELAELAEISADPVPINVIKVKEKYQALPYQRMALKQHPYSRKEQYQYGSANPIKIKLNDVGEKERFMLSESKSFCMYPWMHMHVWPTGQAYPCCHAKPNPAFGNAHTQPMKEIWNNKHFKELRQNMLSDRAHPSCGKCYEQEDAGFFSGRQSANKHHGHHIDRIHNTEADGTYNDFEMTYWDIRFSNLCNLRCRSCGHIFSSQWYQDQAKLAGGDWKKINKPLIYAGRTETDMWEQLVPHLDHVEQIYFAGGEPLLMEEHYNILEELVKRKRFDVRLIYNTNFTNTQLKDKSVFDYWNQFESVAVGASLDASGARGEYIRKGTEWAVVEQNRRAMLEICPQVDFYISPTLSIMNAIHLPDFHREWVEKGLLCAQDLNVNILQDPAHYRIDIATPEYKELIRAKFETHLEWLRPQDHLHRATVGFESAINFMMSTDNSALLKTFWSKTEQLDAIRKENILDIIPELKALK
jgi:radical SAM protein with 4Fe4S-binding SPASM domain